MCKFIYTKFFIKLANNSMVSSYCDKIQYYAYRSYFFLDDIQYFNKEYKSKIKKIFMIINQ